MEVDDNVIGVHYKIGKKLSKDYEIMAWEARESIYLHPPWRLQNSETLEFAFESKPNFKYSYKLEEYRVISLRSFV